MEKRETRRQKIRAKKRRRIIAVSIMSILLIALVFGLIKFFGWIFRGKTPVSANLGPSLPQPGDPITSPPKYYDYTLPVPEFKPVNDSYFDKVLFIGDSRIAGLELYGLLGGADILTSSSLSVDEAFEKKFSLSDKEVTLVEQVASNTYSSIYVMFGLNELGWNYSSAFQSEYSAFVSELKNLAPGSSIYLQSIIPITSGKSGNPSYLTNEKIAEYNLIIKNIAKENKVYYIDLNELLADATGALDGKFAEANGISLTKTGGTEWVNYLKSHVVDKEIYS
jgi:hypothetical protein